MKIAINGFGRIGRNVFKIALEKGVEVVGINDITDTKTLAQLIKYDSTQGRYHNSVEYDAENIIVGGTKYHVSADRNPKEINWGVAPDVVIESTGVFTTRSGERGGYGDHLQNTRFPAKRVILTVPSKDAIDTMIVLGVNEHALQDKHTCISNASCTTNCLAPIAKIIHENFGIENGFMTTVHSYTNDQSILDMPHKDLRRARSAALNQIPTTTGAAKAVGKVLPALAGKLDGCAIRVPTPTGSLVDLVANVSRTVTVDQINAAVRAAANGALQGIVEYTEDPIVSSDVIHNPHSAIFDAQSTMVIDKVVKVFAWYDNEWGYSHRVVDLAKKIA